MKYVSHPAVIAIAYTIVAAAVLAFVVGFGYVMWADAGFRRAIGEAVLVMLGFVAVIMATFVVVTHQEDRGMTRRIERLREGRDDA